MFGQPHFATQNARLNATLTSVGTLIVAHRAVGHGSIAENTTLAVRAAQLSGADMVEIDVTASSDGKSHSFHDGHEPETLGFKANLQTLTAAEIDQVSFIWVDRPGRRARWRGCFPSWNPFAGGPCSSRSIGHGGAGRRCSGAWHDSTCRTSSS